MTDKRIKLSLIQGDARTQRAAGQRPSVRFAHVDEPYEMYRGGTLQTFDIAYETWGRCAADGGNVVLLLTGLSTNTHAAASAADPTPGWWEYMVGPGKPIDTDKFYVICVNPLGGCFGSTGPSSKNPTTGKPYGLDFPALSVEDIAATARLALRTLGIERIAAVVGASLGGMVALAYSVRYPDEVGALVSLSAATRATPYAIAVRSLQRELIRSDPAWRGGHYAPGSGPQTGMRLARKLGMISYRSAQEWQDRFGRHRIDQGALPREPFGIEFEIESYLQYHAAAFVEGYDANSYLYISRAMDWFDLADHGESVDAALDRVQAARALVVGVETDALFPVWQQEEIVAALTRRDRDVTWRRLPSVQGHDAFLVDEARFAPVVREFFSRL